MIINALKPNEFRKPFEDLYLYPSPWDDKIVYLDGIRHPKKPTTLPLKYASNGWFEYLEAHQGRLDDWLKPLPTPPIKSSRKVTFYRFADLPEAISEKEGE